MENTHETNTETKTETKRVTKTKLIIILLSFLLIASVFINIFGYRHYENKYSVKFSHLAPSIAWMDVGDFLSIQNKYFVQFSELKTDIISILDNRDLRGFYGVYFEDLSTGAWKGINEKDSFVAASLLKVPVMVAILKKVERGEIKLNQTVALTNEDLDSGSGTLITKGVGYEITVQNLLVYLIKESDNTALKSLSREFLTDNDILEARLAMGLPVEGDSVVYLGPKQYSNILRALYYSAYLRRTFSETALSIMSETDYNSQIPAGVPEDIPVSHKVGFTQSAENIPSYHDCGIVYHPVKPYILCIMSTGADKIEVDFVMSNISKTTYDYVNKVRV